MCSFEIKEKSQPDCHRMDQLKISLAREKYMNY